MKQTKPYAIVLDISNTGYSVVKCLGKAGIPIMGFHTSSYDPVGRTSRYLDTIHIQRDAGDDRMLEMLLEIGPRLCSKGVIFNPTDSSIDLCSRNYEVLSPYFHIPHTNEGTLHELMGKGIMACIAEKVGIPTPKTLVITSNTLEIRNHLTQIPLPVIVKPESSLDGYKEKMGVERRDYEQLYTRVIRTLETCSAVLVSQFIEGPADSMRDVHALGLASGKQIVGGVVQKLRQHPTLEIGSGTLAQLCIEQDIAKMTRDFGKEVGMVGPYSLDFKRDLEGNPWFIEANFRVSALLGLTARGGVNIPSLAYAAAIGEPFVTPSVLPTSHVRWLDSFRDIDLWRSGQVSALDLIKEYRKEMVFSLFDSSDWMPFVDTTITKILRR